MEGSSFPVVFYDGEQEISMGNVLVSPSLSLKRFQSLLGDKIGISPHQLCVYLEDGTGSRVAVTSRLNVSAFSREKGWFFLVVLKRSRRPWRGRRGGNKLGQEQVQPRRQVLEPHPSVMLLRRDGNSLLARERYLMGLGLGLVSNGGRGGGGFCKECLKREDVEFHSCVNDAVTFGFRSPAGPIARPKK